MDEFNSDHDTDGLEEEEYDEHDDYSSNHHDQQEDDDNEANSTPPHQAGLLRVPCSLRLNSSENTNHYHSHSTATTNSNNNKSTPIAAYVDTGAQVTVISARRYVGRATGVGQCRILGRIPAGCVHFMLGQREDDDEEEYDDDDYEEEERSILQINGPALTVLEGSVTEGVDMLLGLDVLQDWEATIQIGGNARQSSMTVKKRGMSEPVVLPFLVGDSSSIVVKVMVRIGGEGVVVVVVAEPLQLRLIMVNSSIRVEGIQNINNDMQLSKHIINMTMTTVSTTTPHPT